MNFHFLFILPVFTLFCSAHGSVAQRQSVVQQEVSPLKVEVGDVLRDSQSVHVFLKAGLKVPGMTMFGMDDAAFLHLKSKPNSRLLWMTYGHFMFNEEGAVRSDTDMTILLLEPLPKEAFEVEGEVAILAAERDEPMKAVEVTLRENTEFLVGDMPVLLRSLETGSDSVALELKFRDVVGVTRFEFMREDGQPLRAMRESVVMLGLGNTQYTSYRIFTDGKPLKSVKAVPYRWSQPKVFRVPVKFSVPAVVKEQECSESGEVQEANVEMVVL
ncbi:Hypothetical protein PYTT_1154 [Akkermansia glycaniphila]|uniref:Uncharacterized protein n=1 Tax=Akkermansia glycaniphila TaxID=1679444 RepID=A0A1C7PBM9_9BACT|nr:hypothetical protein AC781_07970 [Akkermansia glycaniphila]SEH84326.1 Hypothetical protein PYTT_1154 [Akkermansia glycaniphila]